MLKNLSILTLAVLTSGAFAASTAMKAPMDLEAGITSASEKNLKGDLILKQVKGGLQIKVHVTGLAPNSTHGFHVHENGECAGPDYKSAGGHFNPDHGTHGPADKTTSHMGDLGNLVADAKGEAHVDRIVMTKDMSHFMDMSGKAVIIHAKVDDLKSQPAGDSGDRIACGLIKSI